MLKQIRNQAATPDLVPAVLHCCSMCLLVLCHQKRLVTHGHTSFYKTACMHMPGQQKQTMPGLSCCAFHNTTQQAAHNIKLHQHKCCMNTGRYATGQGVQLQRAGHSNTSFFQTLACPPAAAAAAGVAPSMTALVNIMLPNAVLLPGPRQHLKALRHAPAPAHRWMAATAALLLLQLQASTSCTPVLRRHLTVDEGMRWLQAKQRQSCCGRRIASCPDTGHFHHRTVELN